MTKSALPNIKVLETLRTATWQDIQEDSHNILRALESAPNRGSFRDMPLEEFSSSLPAVVNTLNATALELATDRAISSVGGAILALGLLIGRHHAPQFSEGVFHVLDSLQDHALELSSTSKMLRYA